jgi:imidazolonepropionase
MGLLIKNIGELFQVNRGEKKRVSGKEMATLPTIKSAFLLVKDELIEDFGKMDDCSPDSSHEVVDAQGGSVFPSFCDSHTHLVFADTREEEFEDRIKGLTYEEIAAKGGGIINSANKLQGMDEDELYRRAAKRLEKIISYGTGAIEIKSGYGLTPDAELKMLRVARKLGKNYPVEIKTNFLAAHAFPKEFKENHQGYIDQIINEMMPKVAEEKLADFVDIFCERGYFSNDETDQILTAGAKYGMRPKIHVNQFSISGGIEVALKHNALSVDHLEVLSDEEIGQLKNSECMPTMLPSCSFFIKIPFGPARKVIDSGLPLALATDFNPGSTPSGRMSFVISLACIHQNLLPAEALNATTLNTAYAMGVEEKMGSIDKGKLASFFITDPIKGLSFIPYSFGDDPVRRVFLKGKEFKA